jgi:decaprenylphospho-beta-D-erythro-pentofuranosid-2-ulose 2-reductase
MEKKRRIAIIGATSSIAEHCARLWMADEPSHLILVGRDMQRLERVAQDLNVRSPESTTQIVIGDFSNPQGISSTVKKITQTGNVDIALIAHGSLPEQTFCQEDLQTCSEALIINGLSPVLYAEAFAKMMSKANHGTIGLIGSVAGDRGRRSNYVYGAAKGMVTRYAQGLQHRFADTQVKIVLIKPGPTDTPMTANLKEKGIKLVPAKVVASHIVQGVKTRKHIIYTPKKWQSLMMIIRHLPFFIFRRMNI